MSRHRASTTLPFFSFETCRDGGGGDLFPAVEEPEQGSTHGRVDAEVLARGEPNAEKVGVIDPVHIFSARGCMQLFKRIAV